MAQISDFNANEVKPQGIFEVIPEGEYKAVISASENKPNKKKTGEYLELRFDIVDEGEYKGRTLWARLNLKNPNETAVRIARAELSAICHAVNVLTPGDSNELHNIPLILVVKCKKREDNGNMTNEIKGYKSASGEVVAPITEGDSKAPWKK